jgi:lipopolysaccharide transport system ATP-binding protein
MMSDTAIKIEDLWKQYRYGVISHGYLFRDIQAWLARIRGKSDPHARIVDGQPSTRIASSGDDRFWALREINLEIKQGEVVGIIGRNGAGKSTLLKILSRVTAPTKGRIHVRGRIGSLLEVGTGFHPELTGRENIILNGAILGMRKNEIAKKFDEIVAFAEVDKFIDTPVKRYSSGMYVRLAFAVAAHLDPEILVVDEVLAVGDAQFQKKCLGKIGEVSKNEGRTVIFVSHNMQAIRTLCRRAQLLNNGRIVADGAADTIADLYLKEIPTAQGVEELHKVIQALPQDTTFKLENITLMQNGYAVYSDMANGSPLDIEIAYSVLEQATGLRVYFDLCDLEGALLFRSFNDEQEEGIPIVKPGAYLSRAQIPANLLGPMQYVLRIQAGIFNVRNCLPLDAVGITLDVKNTGSYNRAYLADTFRGKLAPIIPWKTERTMS